MIDKPGMYIDPAVPASKTRQSTPAGKAGQKSAGNVSFHQVLEQVKEKREVVFSAHARERIERRNIVFNPEDIGRIEDAMDKVNAKGARSSLLLYGDVALLASVPNRTIITAVDGAEAREQIYTDIDCAVIMQK